MDNATSKERELDPRDPNDNAFLLVSVLKNCAWIFSPKNHKKLSAHPVATQYPFNFPSKVTQYNVSPARRTCTRNMPSNVRANVFLCAVLDGRLPKNNNTTINYNSKNLLMAWQRWQLWKKELNGNDGNDGNGENEVNEGDTVTTRIKWQRWQRR